jgi:hypothetical protein
MKIFVISNLFLISCTKLISIFDPKKFVVLINLNVFNLKSGTKLCIKNNC